MRSRSLAAAAAAAVAVVVSPAGALSAPAAKAPMAVVALIDTGINPYNVAFRDRSALAYRHPSTYLPGYPKSAKALRVTLDVPYDVAMKRDANIWKNVERGTLYWIPGTRIVGAISLGSGGTNCPVVPTPPANAVGGSCTEHRILDDHGHGTMTASRAAGAPHSLAPTARILEIEGLGAGSVRFAANAGWVDVQSNSWVSLQPPVAGVVGNDVTKAFAAASTRTLTLAASGNGAAFSEGFAPTPTYLLSTAPAGVVLVGAHDNGKAALWSGAPPHIVADGYAGWAAISTSSTDIRPDPIACCTSAASPYAAGGATAIVLAARRILRASGTGIHGGVVARGRAGL
ncbi:MAG: S8/S53 family peptidase, partial [Frankia sp.]|nr:S8/S53 family peptidase [Frankia sp.]